MDSPQLVIAVQVLTPNWRSRQEFLDMMQMLNGRNPAVAETHASKIDTRLQTAVQLAMKNHGLCVSPLVVDLMDSICSACLKTWAVFVDFDRSFL